MGNPTYSALFYLKGSLGAVRVALNADTDDFPTAESVADELNKQIAKVWTNGGLFFQIGEATINIGEIQHMAVRLEAPIGQPDFKVIEGGEDGD